MTKRTSIWISLSLILVPVTGTARADSLISEPPNWSEYDGNARAAYNPQNGQFLVVWNVFNPFATTLQGLYGPVRGQLIAENGQKLGAPFEIISAGGVLADVAYNSKNKEYFVVAEQWFNTVGQRIDSAGKKAGGATPITLMTNARFPRVAYNSLQNSYLVVGGWLDPPVGNQCALHVYTTQVGTNGYPIGSASNIVNDTQSCNAVDKFALAYAPLEKDDPVYHWNSTPYGRYLLAVGDGPLRLRMLNASGQLLPTYWVDTCIYNPQYPCHFEYYLPTQWWWGNNLSLTFNIDVAYGKGEFALVWSDVDSPQVFNGFSWTGVKMGWVDANRTLYFASDTSLTKPLTQGPVSWIWDHDPTHPWDWRPRVAFNGRSDGTPSGAMNEFVVAWRETPTTNPKNDVTVNHTRFNVAYMNRSFQNSSPELNTVMSQPIPTANPIVPFIASSTETTKVMVGWSDFRSGFARTYGALVDAGTPWPRQVTDLK